MQERLTPSFIEKMNKMGKASEPFLFAIDYNLSKPLLYPLEELKNAGIFCQIEDGLVSFNNSKAPSFLTENDLFLQKQPISFTQYKRAFDLVKENLALGNSFLTNLTGETPVESSLTLRDIFHASAAKYKFYIEDQFLSFSPESFVKIDARGTLASYPMKGTMEVRHGEAKTQILNNKKESYEHATIVDLIRNDISKVAEKVWVSKYRYVESIQRAQGLDLLQVSSEVKGQLSEDWKHRIGSIFAELLPAGSITGAPKDKTIQIIKRAENYTYQNPRRGYYTGVFGVFDGAVLSSAVMIRCLEKRSGKLFFKSGGGITHLSDAQEEYEELLAKIYIPFHRVHTA